MLEIGSLVDGKYKILNEIGHGGMSIVYLAIVERANQTWAIKEVRKNGATKEDIVQQGLVAEMNILKRLDHPHLPRIIDIIDHEDSFLIVMDYIEGIDLDKKLREGPQKWSDVVEWAKQLCDVFAYLHSRKPPIIYRDMKPGNVKLKPNGDVVLFDFGTAREYKSQKAGDDTTCLGTRGYASPEQYGGMGQTDARSDIYCLGATMFHLVTGRLPGGPPDYSIPPIRSICPWLPRTGKEGNCVRGLEKIIMKCVEPSPANRYQNCAELMYDLEHIDKISDEFIKAQKRKLNTWITCMVFTVILAICSGVLSNVAKKTTDNSYQECISKTIAVATGSMSPKDVEYEMVKKGLLDAIDIDPSKPQAWIYLSRLYASDLIISSEEYTDMQSKLSNNETKIGKQSNAYAQICMEWGESVFIFFNNDPKATVALGAPDKAESYLKVVVGDREKDADNYRKLICNAVDSDVQQFAIREVNDTDAKNRYSLAVSLYAVARQWNTLGHTNKSKETYTYSEYWNDLKGLLASAKTLDDGSLNVTNITSLRVALYSNVMIRIYNKFSELVNEGGAKPRADGEVSVDAVANKVSQRIVGGETDTSLDDISIEEMIEYVRSESEKLRKVSGEELISLIDNIDKLYDEIKILITSKQQ